MKTVKSIILSCVLLITTNLLSENLYGQVYCDPTVSVAGGGGIGITRVNTNTDISLNRVSPATEGYINTGQSAIFSKGRVFALSLDVDAGTNCLLMNIRVYIDYNNDKDFYDGNEMIASSDSVASGTHNYTFSVPSPALIVTTRMRVMVKMVEGCGHSSIEPCGVDTGAVNLYHGEIEDYNVDIIPALSTEDGKITLSNWNIYLDPTERQLHLTYFLQNESTISVEVYSMLGQNLLTLPFGKQHSGTHRQIIRLDDEGFLPEGIYLIRLRVGSQSFTKRISKR